MQTYFPTLAMSMVATLSLLFMSACHSNSNSGSSNSIKKANFGKTKAGEVTEIYTLKNANGVIAKVTNYGATLVELHAPDKAGKLADVVNGFDNVAGYEGDGNQYFGCTTGRVCNRNAKGKFTLDG